MQNKKDIKNRKTKINKNEKGLNKHVSPNLKKKKKKRITGRLC